MHLAFEVAAVGAAAYLMIRSGLQSRLLERPRFGVCPSCGRKRVRGVCDTCTRRG
jgi:hypothetical protein